MNMETTIHFCGSLVRIAARVHEYAGNRATCVRLVDTADGSPFATLSVNVPEHSDKLPFGTFFLKDYSENAAIALQLKRQKFIIPAEPPVFAAAGFEIVEAHRLNPEWAGT